MARADRLGADERRTSILEASWAILDDGGLDALTIDAIVTRLGVSRPIFYRHFSDRNALIAALYGDFGEVVVARTRAALAVSTSLDGVLVDTARAYLDCVDERGASMRDLLGQVTSSSTFTEVRESVDATLARALMDAVRRYVTTVDEHVVLTEVRLLQAVLREGGVMLASHTVPREVIEAATVRMERYVAHTLTSTPPAE